MKNLILFISISIIFTGIYSQNISELSISNEGSMILDFDRYTGSINRYGDRLFVQNFHKIEEFKILHDGSLERIGFHETRSLGTGNIIDSNRLYHELNLDYINNEYTITEVTEIFLDVRALSSVRKQKNKLLVSISDACMIICIEFVKRG